MRPTFLFAVVATVTALLTAACGDSDGARASGDGPAVKTVEVKMVDLAYEPEDLAVEAGQEVRFVFVNAGKIRHEAYIGDAKEQAAHEDEMKDGDSGGGHDAHGGGNPKITVEPGQEGDLTYRFEEAGTFEIGCHEPGHYDAGMKLTVVVS